MKIAFKMLGLVMLTFLFSCTKDYYQPPDTGAQDVSFKNEIIPVFKSNCISCHQTGMTKPDLTENHAYSELTTNNEYVVPGKPNESELYHRVTGMGGMMPPGGMMAPTNTDKIKAWIEQGALNN